MEFSICAISDLNVSTCIDGRIYFYLQIYYLIKRKKLKLFFKRWKELELFFSELLGSIDLHLLSTYDL